METNIPSTTDIETAIRCILTVARTKEDCEALKDTMIEVLNEGVNSKILEIEIDSRYRGDI